MRLLLWQEVTLIRCKRIIIVMLAPILIGCGGAAVTPALLPTATPEPTAIIPTPTSTMRPPPTVTPFPTLPGGEDSAEVAEATQPSTTETPGASTEAPTATTAAPTDAPTQALGSPTPSPTDTPIPTPTSSPTPTATPTSIAPAGVNLGNRLYEADFYQGWPTINESSSHIYLVNGVYLFEIGPNDAGYMTTGTIVIDNFYAAVEVTPRDCVTRGGFGLWFRFADNSNYYAFNIWCDDTYTVTGRDGGILNAGLAEGALPDVLGDETHKIAIAAVGDEFALYYDNTLLDTFEDDAHPEGDVAMFAVSQNTNVISVAFDNLEVWTLR